MAPRSELVVGHEKRVKVEGGGTQLAFPLFLLRLSFCLQLRCFRASLFQCGVLRSMSSVIRIHGAFSLSLSISPTSLNFFSP